VFRGSREHRRRRSKRRRRRRRKRKREKERWYVGGFIDTVVACTHGDILLICLNYYCYNYHGTSSGWECAFGSLGRGFDLHEEN
jgi:hypothetical protein